MWFCGGSVAASPESVSISVVSDTGVVEALALAESRVEDNPSIGVEWESCRTHESACETLDIALCGGQAMKDYDGGGRVVLLEIANC